MQKAIIIQAGGYNKVNNLDASELNKYLEEGWSVVHMAPVGCSVGSEETNSLHQSAALVIIEKL